MAAPRVSFFSFAASGVSTVFDKEDESVPTWRFNFEMLALISTKLSRRKEATTDQRLCSPLPDSIIFQS
jgi:hypothetical protein